MTPTRSRRSNEITGFVDTTLPDRIFAPTRTVDSRGRMEVARRFFVTPANSPSGGLCNRMPFCNLMGDSVIKWGLAQGLLRADVLPKIRLLIHEPEMPQVYRGYPHVISFLREHPRLCS